MSKLYLECYTGISGDMMTGALLDLGADPEKLGKVLETVPLGGFQIRVSRVCKSGLDACDFDVVLDKELNNHDHDMNFLYGNEEHHEHDHQHGHKHQDHHHEHDHHHEDGQDHHHDHEVPHEHHHSHTHRTLTEILEILDKTQMTDRAKETARRIFRILADAEAKAHGSTPQEVHFHEAGAVDSIVDVISAAVCLDDLNIEEVVIPVLYEGSGSIHCQHGTLPVPVPAVLNVAEMNHLPLCITDRKAELITPTGAAIAAAIMTEDHLPKRFHILKSGIGAGKRAYEVPSLLRAMLIEK